MQFINKKEANYTKLSISLVRDTKDIDSKMFI